MSFSIAKGGQLRVSFTFIFEHDNGTVEEQVRYIPSEVDRQMRVEHRKDDDGKEETRTVQDEGEPPEGWSKRSEYFWEWLDRVTDGPLPFTDEQGKPMTATQIANEYPEYRFLLRELENQIRTHHSPLLRNQMDLFRRS